MLSTIRFVRLGKGIKLIDVAKATKLSPSLISQIETGKLRGSLRTRKKIAMVFKVSVKQLFGGK